MGGRGGSGFSSPSGFFSSGRQTTKPTDPQAPLMGGPMAGGGAMTTGVWNPAWNQPSQQPAGTGELKLGPAPTGGIQTDVIPGQPPAPQPMFQSMGRGGGGGWGDMRLSDLMSRLFG